MSTPWTKQEEKEGACSVCLEVTDVAACDCGHRACEGCRYGVLEDGKQPLLICDDCDEEDAKIEQARETISFVIDDWEHAVKTKDIVLRHSLDERRILDAREALEMLCGRAKR